MSPIKNCVVRASSVAQRRITLQCREVWTEQSSAERRGGAAAPGGTAKEQPARCGVGRHSDHRPSMRLCYMEAIKGS